MHTFGPLGKFLEQDVPKVFAGAGDEAARAEFTKQNEADLAPLQLSAQAKRHIDRYLAGGYQVVIPSRRVEVDGVDVIAYYAHDVASGDIIGVTEDGLHGSSAAYARALASLARDLANNHRVSVAGRRVLLLGAGGAARGVLAPLLGLQPSHLVIVNRTVQRARELAQEFGDLGHLQAMGYDELNGSPYDLVINATAASLSGELPALPAGIVNKDSICYDMAYARDETPFVRWALERGVARAMDGLGMLVEQAAEAFFLWRGVRPQTAGIIASLRAALAAA